MMDLRKRIFIIASIIVGIILTILLFYIFVFRGSEEPAGETQIGEGAGAGVVTDLEDLQAGEGQIPPVVAAEPLSEETRVKQVARIFIERFGSYSNQNGNSHIDDVLPMLTSEMAQWVKTQGVEASNDYQGMTSKVIASSVTSLTTDVATVTVGVQRFVEDHVVGETEYASGRVELLLEDGDWKIDGLYWD